MALLSVAVIVNEEPEFSAILLGLVIDNVTSGATSPPSVIVIVSDCVPSSVADPPETPVIATMAVSFPSYTLSSVGSNVAVPVVSPAEIVISEIFA